LIKKSAARHLTFLRLVCIAIALFLNPVHAHTKPITGEATVTSETLDLYQNPQEGSEPPPVATLQRGSTATVLDSDADGEWLQVQLPSGEEGWVLACCLRLASASTAEIPIGQGTVTSRGLNLRPGPGTEYGPPLSILLQDASVTVIGSNADGEWLQVQLPSGEQGWVSGCCVRAGSMTSTAPTSVIASSAGMDRLNDLPEWLFLGGLLLLVALWIAWSSFCRQRSVTWRSVPVLQWKDIQDGARIRFGDDLKDLAGRDDPVDGMPFRVGESLIVCLTCKTAYRPASLEFAVQHNNGMCLGCRRPPNARCLTVGALINGAPREAAGPIRSGGDR
jgi:uncharacterized protein YraI